MINMIDDFIFMRLLAEFWVRVLLLGAAILEKPRVNLLINQTICRYFPHLQVWPLEVFSGISRMLRTPKCGHQEIILGNIYRAHSN